MEINDALRKFTLVPKEYINKGQATIVNTHKGRFVFKNSNINPQIMEYLKSRNFDYMPRCINSNYDDYRIDEYIEGYDIPKEQKMLDLIHLVALLHSKTTHYKEIDEEYYEEIYDDISGNIEYLYGYYTDIITLIESKVYMSPSEYLLARNINKVYFMIDKCSERLEEWHALVKEKKKQRNVVLHNNLSLDHFIRNDRSYLISWDKAKIGNPVFDIYKLYKRHALEFDFSDILREYEKHYPLLREEKELFDVLVIMPDVITLNNNEYENCKEVNCFIDSLDKANSLTKRRAEKEQ